MEDRVIYETANGVKPRYDQSGTEFGLMHRDLGPGFLMFDIDRMSAVLEVNLEMRRENEGFVEFRQNRNGIQFVAMFEVKHKRTPHSEAVLDPSKANSMARIEMAKRLRSRLFVVFGTNGKQPYDFFEINTDNGEYELLGTLEYNASNRTENCRDFWKNVLKIEKNMYN